MKIVERNLEQNYSFFCNVAMEISTIEIFN